MPTGFLGYVTTDEDVRALEKLKVPSVLLNDAVVPELRRKFGFRSAYCDVHTAVRPWHRVDYDARCPGAGTFSQVFYAWGELLLRQRELLDGPVWSEGGIHFMFAGLADGNYASDYWYDFAKHPWLVDFDLLKIHPLECDFGMGSLSMFSHPYTVEERDFYLPGVPEGRDRLVDSFIAATLAFGRFGRSAALRLALLDRRRSGDKSFRR